jgi:hypothetical protein
MGRFWFASLVNLLVVDHQHRHHAVDVRLMLSVVCSSYSSFLSDLTHSFTLLEQLQGDSHPRHSDAVPLQQDDIDAPPIIIEVVDIHVPDHRHLDVDADSRTLEVAAPATLVVGLTVEVVAVAPDMVHEVEAAPAARAILEVEAEAEVIREAYREVDAKSTLLLVNII